MALGIRSTPKVPDRDGEDTLHRGYGHKHNSEGSREIRAVHMVHIRSEEHERDVSALLTLAYLAKMYPMHRFQHVRGVRS
jgi:hypothetical protein